MYRESVKCLEYLPRLFPSVRSYLFSFNRVFSSPISRKAARNRSWKWFDCSENRSSDSESFFIIFLLSGTRHITLSGLWSRNNALGYCRIFVNPTNSTLLTAITYRTEQRSTAQAISNPPDRPTSAIPRFSSNQSFIFVRKWQRDNSRLWKNFITI